MTVAVGDTVTLGWRPVWVESMRVTVSARVAMTGFDMRVLLIVVINRGWPER